MVARKLASFLALSSSLLLAPAASAQMWESCSPRAHQGDQSGNQFGWIGVRAGDVDNDGVEDYLTTAPFKGGNNIGQVRVFSGAAGGLLYEKLGTANENLGWSGSSAGDLNGDGHSEFMAGAPATGPGGLPGSVYVWSGIDGSLMYPLVGESPGDQFGQSVANAGDVDGDGTDDIAIGAPVNSATGTFNGRVYVHSGASGLRIRTFESRGPAEQFGIGVAGVGDRNMDGFADLMVGAVTGGQAGTGIAYVVSGADGSTIWTMPGDANNVTLGQWFLGPCGDVDNDGTEDLFVSDFNNSALGASTGRVFVHSGVGGGLLYTITGEGPGDGFGIGRGWAGDVDGDGFDDLVFGHWTSSTAASRGGKVSIFRGVDGSRYTSWTGSVNNATLGFDAAGLGDIDGDLVPDFLITAAGDSASRGVAYVVSGANPLPPVNTCVTTPNSVGAGALMTFRNSTSLAANQFRIRVTGVPVGVSGLFLFGLAPASTPFGAGTMCVAPPRRRIRPVLQVGPQGAPSRLLDFTQPPLAGSVAAGTTVWFQLLYRDPQGPAGNRVTLSDGLQVTFCP